MYTVVKSHAHINGKVYSKGDDVELDDDLALTLLANNIVISLVDTKLPTDADGLFEEIKKENEKLKESIEQQKGIIARFTEELTKKDEIIASLKTKRR